MLSEKIYSKEGLTRSGECDGNWDLNDVVVENRLSQVLAQALLPSMAKKINIQALLVYKSDDKANRSFIVNDCFQRDDTTDNKMESDTDIDRPGAILVKESSVCAEHSLSLPNWTDSSAESVASPITPNCKSFPEQTSSRRKRKFCRPCKIPQVTEQPSRTPIPPEETLILKSESQPVSLLSPMPLLVEPNYNLPLLSESLLNALSNKFLVKTERVSTSRPVTSPPAPLPFNTPRPIRPKLSVDNNQSKPQCIFLNNHCTADLSTSITTTINERQPIQGYESCDTEDSLAAARRYAKSFVCNQCRFVFSSLNGLCEHTYSLHKAFRCTFCQAQFTQRSNLQRHSLRHVGFKPFVCGVCSKEYYRKDHLVRHIEVTHPTVDAKNSVIVKLSSAECLEYLEALTEQKHRELNISAQFPAASTESEGIVVLEKT